LRPLVLARPVLKEVGAILAGQLFDGGIVEVLVRLAVGLFATAGAAGAVAVGVVPEPDQPAARVADDLVILGADLFAQHEDDLGERLADEDALGQGEVRPPDVGVVERESFEFFGIAAELALDDVPG